MTRHANAEPRNIHFLTTSNKVSPLDQSVPIVEELLQQESEGIDCQVLVVAKELSNQLASTTRKYCWICMVRTHLNQFIITLLSFSIACV